MVVPNLRATGKERALGPQTMKKAGTTKMKTKTTPAKSAGEEEDKKARKGTGLPRSRRHLPLTSETPAVGKNLSNDEVPESLSKLHSYATLLQQLHVRHKNQHRGQVWFKQMSFLRRAVRDLLDVESELHELLNGRHDPERKAEEVRNRFEREKALGVRKEELEEWTREVLVPRCYVRFSSVLADGDGSFANLGVVLVGIVAGVAGCVGGPSLKDEEQRDSNIKIDDQGLRIEEGGRVGMARKESRKEGVDEDMEVEGDDFGTVVQRPAVTGDADTDGRTRALKETEDEQAQELPKDKRSRAAPKNARTQSKKASSQAGNAASSEAKVKKAKRKKNAIDDLFAGFV